MAQQKEKTMNEKNNAIAEEKQLPYLLGIINNAISRYRDAINRYYAMNDHLTGPQTECGISSGETPVTESGIMREIIDRAEVLHDLCAAFDNENNRLNKIIIDG